MRFVVIYDACVLYPAPLRDLLLRLATKGLFAARWTRHIHREWQQALRLRRPDLDTAKLERTRDLMDRAVPDSLVTGYEDLIDALKLPDPDDRHVLAAAIVAYAQMIVTFNTRDFPEASLRHYGIEAIHPDQFVACQMDLSEAAVLQAVKEQRAALNHPPRSARELLDTLAACGLPVCADRLREFENLI